MPFEDETDLAAFFDPGDFGEPAVVTPAAGPPVSRPLLFWEQAPQASPDTTDKPHDGPVAELPAAGLPDDLDGAGVELTRSGRRFTVKRGPRSRDGAMRLLHLVEKVTP